MRRAALGALVVLGCTSGGGLEAFTSRQALLAPEQPADPPVAGAAMGAQTTNAVGASDAGFFVAWFDYRNGPGDTFGTRLDPLGHVLDPGGLQLSSSGSDTYRLAVVWDGTNWVTTWFNAIRIYAGRVSPAGAVLDPGGVDVFAGTNNRRNPAIAYGGGQLFLVWEDQRGADVDIYGSRLSPTLAALDPNGIAIATATKDQTWPTVSWASPNFVVAWSDKRSGTSMDIYATTVSLSGAVGVLNGAPISATANDEYQLTSAGDGTNVLLAWIEATPGGDDVNYLRLSPSAAKLDAAPITASGPYIVEQLPSAAFDGNNFVVVWQHYAAIYGARIAKAGQLIGSAFSICCSRQSALDPAVGAYGGLTFTSFHDTRGSSEDVDGMRLDGGAVLDPDGFVVATSSNEEAGPAVAGAGPSALAAWSDGRGHATGIWGVHLTNAGAPVEAASFPIATALDTRRYPRLAFDGSRYVMLWQGLDQFLALRTYAAHLTPQGNIIEDGGVQVSTASPNTAQLALNRDGLALALWTTFAQAVGARRFAADGGVLDPVDLPLAPNASEGAVASDGTDFFSVWNDHRPDAGGLWGGGIRADGGLGAPLQLAASPQPSQGGAIGPALTFGQHVYLVAFQGVPGDRSVYALPFFPDGGSAGPLLPLHDAGFYTPRNLVAASDGPYLLVAWDYGSPRPVVELVTLDEATGLVTRHDTWSPPDAGQWDDELALASVAPGADLVAYTRRDGVAGSARVEVRAVTTLWPGQPCTLPAECGSGACSGGVCCQTLSDGGCGLPLLPADAGAPDAGSSDAGALTMVDGGVDAGADAGETLNDAGAQSEPDAGTPGPRFSVGCASAGGCASADGTSWWFLLAVLGYLLLSRARW